MKFFKLYILTVLISTLLIFPASVHAATLKKAKAPTKKATPVKIVPKPAGQLLISSATDLKLAPNESVVVRFGFKNTGKLAWKTRLIQLQGADGALFATSTWSGATTPVKISGEDLKTGRLEFFDVPIQAPEQAGSYLFKAAFIVDGTQIQTLTLPIEVVNAESNTVIAEQLLPEPRIRVALGKTEGPVSVRISTGSYQINLLDGTPVAMAGEGDKFFIQYEPTGKMYILTFNGTVTTSTQPFRALGSGPNSRFVLTDKDDAAKWNKKIVYNEYRDTFELRWSDKIPGAWLINELPIEHYLKGLIETGNSEPYELQKAVYTAARTYAYIYLPVGGQAGTRTWDVHSVWDQVYKGYSAEVSNPNGARAVDETRGVLVTYDHKPVVTPYFTRSDGVTRGWKAVWGGQDKPWLQPVAAKYDVGKKLWGHGVGMSTQDAKAHVQKDGWTFDHVLTYYYTGIQLQKVYE